MLPCRKLMFACGAPHLHNTASPSQRHIKVPSIITQESVVCGGNKGAYNKVSDPALCSVMVQPNDDESRTNAMSTAHRIDNREIKYRFFAHSGAEVEDATEVSNGDVFGPYARISTFRARRRSDRISPVTGDRASWSLGA